MTLPQSGNSGPQFLNGWTYLHRIADVAPVHLMLMLHGWTGDETSMFFFAQRMPGQYHVLLPRAPYKVPEGGYSWRQIIPGSWGLPTHEELRSSAIDLLRFLDDWSFLTGVAIDHFGAVGFSQGAAMALSLAVLAPERVESLAVLSGFLPGGSEELLSGLVGKRIYISHGSHDEMIPVERARQLRFQLERAGASVTYCESDGGHKVGKECVNDLKTFFSIE